MKDSTRLIVYLFLISGWVILPIQAETWAEGSLRLIEKTPEKDPPAEDLRRLATFASNLSEEADIVEVRQKALARLLAVPDFADRLAGEVRHQKERWLSGKQTWSSYDTQRAWTLHAFGSIRHPDVVRVLGEFLTDLEWPGYDGDPRSGPPDLGRIHPNGIIVARALGKLIEDPPIQKHPQSYSFDEAEIFQLWYAQVAAGNRTFRFKGDPQEYSLQGPVSKAIEPMATRPRKNDAPAAGPEATGAQQGWPLMTVGVLVASCGLLGGAVWTVLRQRPRTTDG